MDIVSYRIDTHPIFAEEPSIMNQNTGNSERMGTSILGMPLGSCMLFQRILLLNATYSPFICNAKYYPYGIQPLGHPILCKIDRFDGYCI